MALLDLNNKYLPDILDIALDSQLKVSITYESSDGEITAKYEFIKKSEEDKSIVCVSCESCKQDPLKLFGSRKSTRDFLGSIDHNFLGFRTKEISLYPKEWTTYFCQDYAEKLKDVKMKIPSIIEKAKMKRECVIKSENDISSNEIENKRLMDKKMIESFLTKF